MSDLYLDTLDELLAQSTAGLSQAFVQLQVRFVVAQQQPDGGFAGRQGGSDLYYGDFALRILSLLAPRHPGVARFAQSLARRPLNASSLVEAFNILNINRLLARCGWRTGPDERPQGVAEEPSPPPSPGVPGEGGRTARPNEDSMPFALDAPSLAASILEYLLPQGGFASWPGGTRLSAYHTFLAALCCQSLGLQLPLAGDAATGISALRCPDGGFAELPGESAGQTNATAAATAFLAMHDALADDVSDAVTRFLLAMQAPDGGLKAHAAAAAGDLLSSFTGALTLWGLGSLERLDLAATARFVRATACAEGGFRSCPADTQPDIEYTYYGLGTLALLRLCAPS